MLPNQHGSLIINMAKSEPKQFNPEKVAEPAQAQKDLA